MKTRFDSQLNKKGLTLMETLIVVAIVVILGAIAFIGVQNLVDRNKQTKLDNIAQSMYVSAQNRIRELKASGEIDRLFTAEETELGYVKDKPADWDDGTAATVSYGDLRYLYHNKDKSLDSTSSELVDLFFPKGSIADDVLDDNWVIELDPVTGYVYSAFYSEERSADNFYVSNTDTLDQSGTDSIRSKDFRHSLKGEDKVGYYGGKANMPADMSGDTINASLNIINADILKAKMTAFLPSVSEINALEFELTVKGITSKQTVTFTQTVTPDKLVPTKVFSASVILDKLELGQRFQDTFGSSTWIPPDNVQVTGSLIPGEDLELSFTVSSSDNSVLDVGPITRTANSLFASLNPNDPAEAYIAYGRHLQNLDWSTSHLPDTITSAKQISDIDFNDDSDNKPTVEEPFRWKTLYDDKPFTPINNQNLNIYSGYIATPATDAFKILNMHIVSSTEPAGLFGNFAGSEISGVAMVNEKIDGGTDVGGLVGTATSDLTISDVTMDNTKIDSGTDVGGLVGNADSNLTISGVTMDKTKINGGTDVGGLVGTATSDLTISGVTMDNTQIDSGTDVGGLVGTADSNLTISDVTMDNTQINGSTDVGGLVGTADSNLTISNVKMDNTQIDSGTNVGGLVGTATSTSNLTISDVTMDNTKIDSSTDVGGLVGVGTAGSDLTISDVTMVNTKIDGGTDVGGLVGVGTAGSGLTISDVTMVNTQINGSTNVGGLVGITESDLTIENCQLYVEKDYFTPGTYYTDNILLKGTSNVGGLVGSSTAANLTIEHSFASTIIEGTGSIGGLIGKTSGNASIQDSYADSYLIGGASTSKIGGLAGELAAGSSISGSYSAGFGMIKSGEDIIAAAAGFVPNEIASVTNSYSLFNSSESEATTIYSTVPSATTVTNVYYFKSDASHLEGSEEYKFTSITEAFNKLGSNFSDDNNEDDTYPYNQKTDLDPQPLVTYPYLSITDLPHYGDWKIPPEPEEEPDFGKTGLFYWENVQGGSAPGYQIYIVGRKKAENETENEVYEAVFHDTINTLYNDGGIVKEYGYGYYVAKKGDGTETYALDVSWNNVNVSATNPVYTNTSANLHFNTHAAYKGYEFHCYTTCDAANPATSYSTTSGNNAKKYMFMTAQEQNVQNAAVTLTLKDENETSLNYSFCPFFAKSIKLEGWNNLNWTDNTRIKPALQDEPGTAYNQYRIRSLDQLQFINWNNLSRTNNRMTNNDRVSTFGSYYCNHFPYLISTARPSSIIRNPYNYWFYSPLLPLDGLSDFTTLRARQNFIQDYDIECIGRTGYTPIAALGETSGTIALTYRVPFFAWFGGNFDGQSYKIKNLSITSGCYSVGVFGLTVSATIKNVVLIRDSKDIVPVVIKRPAGSPQGYYAIGTLVGMANEYSTGTYNGGVSPYDDYEGVIENCAVAGYEVIDESDQPVSCGETTIGGLAGVLRTKINRCSAVTTIRINTKNNRGTGGGLGLIGYEDNITVGGIAGTNQTRIYNCYSGGRVIVSDSLTNPNIYISGIASSAFTCRAVNMHDIWDNSWAFISPNYYNCYSYMDLPQPAGNVKVAVIGGDAYYSEVEDLFKPVVGGELNNCHYYANNYKTDQMIISDEPGWIDNGIYSKSYDDMFLEQFCTDLNDSSSPAPYRKITSSNYSFPCGDASLEGKIFPFPAVITQEYSGEYVHYGKWPIVRRLELTKADMTLDLISYHEDENNNIVDDYYDETEVKFYDCGSYPDIVLSNLEIRIDAANNTWVNFDANQPVIIDDKVSVSASVSEPDGICKLTVTGIDKTELTEILLRYSVEDGYYSEAQLNVDVTAVVTLSANPPITDTTVKPGETVKWNLILTDKNNNLIDSDEITTTGENWNYSSTSNNPADPSTPEAVVFNLSITKATPDPSSPPSSPFYLEATAQNAGEADFKVQALRIKVRDENNTDGNGNRRTFDSNIVSDDLHAICYTGKLILRHHVGDGTEAYTDNSYIYKNGTGGIDPDLISTDTDKTFSTLRADMIARDSRFTGWYIKDETNGNHQKLLNPDGTICTEGANIDGFTHDGKFNVNPERDIELYAMWQISYNPLTFVTGPEPPETLDNTTNTIKYLVLARVPREEAVNPEYYCMTGVVSPSTNSPVTATKVDLQQDAQGNYFLTSLVSENTMLWDVTNIKNTKYFKLFNNNRASYIKPVSNKIYDVVFCNATNGVYKPQYDSANHNLFFSGQDRIVLNDTQTGFSFEHMKGQGTGQNPDGGIWLFEYNLNPDPQEILHEFK